MADAVTILAMTKGTGDDVAAATAARRVLKDVQAELEFVDRPCPDLLGRVGCGSSVVIDTVTTGRPAGEIISMPLKEALADDPIAEQLLGPEYRQLREQADPGSLWPCVFVGIEGVRVEGAAGLSPEVSAALPAFERAAIAALTSLELADRNKS